MSAVGSPEGADAAFQRPSRLARAERRATRRRFLAGGLGTLAATAAVTIGSGSPAGATTTPATPYSLPPYRSRRDWGCDESLALDEEGKRIWPVEFYPVQKITVHHTASYTPWSPEEAEERRPEDPADDPGQHADAGRHPERLHGRLGRGAPVALA